MKKAVIDKVDAIYKKQKDIVDVMTSLCLYDEQEYMEILALETVRNCEEIAELTKNCDHKMPNGKSAKTNLNYCAICLQDIKDNRKKYTDEEMKEIADLSSNTDEDIAWIMDKYI